MLLLLFIIYYYLSSKGRKSKRREVVRGTGVGRQDGGTAGRIGRLFKHKITHRKKN